MTTNMASPIMAAGSGTSLSEAAACCAGKDDDVNMAASGGTALAATIASLVC